MDQRQRLSPAGAGGSLGFTERLFVYLFGLGCLVACVLESPVPMAIAP
jgi:hypothetical protein